MSDDEAIPTKEKLARAIEARKGNTVDTRVDRMIRLARQGHYDSYESELTTPIIELVNALRNVGYTDLAQRAINGDFDGTVEEGKAWMSKEGWDFLTANK